MATVLYKSHQHSLSLLPYSNLEHSLPLLPYSNLEHCLALLPYSNLEHSPLEEDVQGNGIPLCNPCNPFNNIPLMVFIRMAE